mmetsp:Transcript_18477/g.26833  ORF Transcript_18477/g.26833 Transcript_18477/m.26833 type:complete len:80 (-) Transcript_18477:102-341(-)
MWRMITCCGFKVPGVNNPQDNWGCVWCIHHQLDNISVPAQKRSQQQSKHNKYNKMQHVINVHVQVIMMYLSGTVLGTHM